jgi:hypothetical protein
LPGVRALRRTASYPALKMLWEQGGSAENPIHFCRLLFAFRWVRLHPPFGCLVTATCWIETAPFRVCKLPWQPRIAPFRRRRNVPLRRPACCLASLADSATSRNLLQRRHRCCASLQDEHERNRLVSVRTSETASFRCARAKPPLFGASKPPRCVASNCMTWICCRENTTFRCLLQPKAASKRLFSLPKTSPAL